MTCIYFQQCPTILNVIYHTLFHGYGSSAFCIMQELRQREKCGHIVASCRRNVSSFLSTHHAQCDRVFPMRLQNSRFSSSKIKIANPDKLTHGMYAVDRLSLCTGLQWNWEIQKPSNKLTLKTKYLVTGPSE